LFEKKSDYHYFDKQCRFDGMLLVHTAKGRTQECTVREF
jgi:hypothetical protein